MNNGGPLVQQHNTQRERRQDATGVPVSVSHGFDFYETWLRFLFCLNNVRRSDIKVMAHLLLRRDEISSRCPDPEIVDEILFSSTERNKVNERIGCSKECFRQSLMALRKCGAIKGNKVNQRIIPHFIYGGDYMLMIHFRFNDSNKS